MGAEMNGIHLMSHPVGAPLRVPVLGHNRLHLPLRVGHDMSACLAMLLLQVLPDGYGSGTEDVNYMS
jgi:hypothetical protein